MNFSELVPYSTAAFSHAGDSIAIAKDRDVFVYDADRLSILHKFQLPVEVMRVLWSPDDNFLMCVNTQQQCLHLRTLNSKVVSCAPESWTGTIEDMMLVGAVWTPDSRQIITFTDLQLRATVWNLHTQSATAFIKAPKLVPPKGIGFSSNGKFMCLGERKDCADWVSIYYCGLDFKLTNAFEVSGDTFDMQDCKWTMKNTAILVQDSPLESKFVLYSAMTGRPIAVHAPNANSGLGIRNLSVSPSEQLLVCGMFDQHICLYNNLSQRAIVDLEHVS